MNCGSITLTEPVILHPRPLERQAGGILLLPLLPYPDPLKPLPGEIWFRIFTFVYDEDIRWGDGKHGTLRCQLLTVCKSLHAIVAPAFYSRVWIRTVWQLDKFTSRLQSAEQKWDSIRRIPYSAPGRWVQGLDLTKLEYRANDAFIIDELLTRLFPLLPFLTQFLLNTNFVMSRRALGSLTFRDGTHRLRVLKGIKAPAAFLSGVMMDVDNDPLVQLVRNSALLEDLEIIGPGFDASEGEFAAQLTDPRTDCDHSTKNALRLDKLVNLTIVSTHSSPLMFALLVAHLPSLRRLTLTPYDDIPYPVSLVSRFIEVHGWQLRSLHLYTPRNFWPRVSHPSPKDLLIHCPELHHLSLDNPLPRLTLPSPDYYNHNLQGKQHRAHPLNILTIPRPTCEYLTVIETMLPSLKNLQIVKARDVRWLKKGMTARAFEAGVQGELKAWKGRLSSRGITVLDADNT